VPADTAKFYYQSGLKSKHKVSLSPQPSAVADTRLPRAGSSPCYGWSLPSVSI